MSSLSRLPSTSREFIRGWEAAGRGGEAQKAPEPDGAGLQSLALPGHFGRPQRSADLIALGAGRIGPCGGGGENLGFYTEGGGTLEGCAQRRGGAWLRCSQAPSSGCCWEGRLWGLSLGARTPGWRQLRWSRGVMMAGKSVPGRGNMQCKGPEAGPCLVCWRNSNEAHVAGAE